MILSTFRNGVRAPFKPEKRAFAFDFLSDMRPNGFLWKFGLSPDGKLWMANVFMNEAKESILDRNIDLIADTLKCALVTATYTANADDQFIDAGGASDVVDARASGTTDQTLAGKAIGKDTTNDFAYFDANDSVFTAVSAGSAIVAAVVYKDTGTPTTSKIVGYFDIPDVTPNGGDITIQWAAAASGAMFKLA
jgi:hypothetical protein